MRAADPLRPDPTLLIISAALGVGALGWETYALSRRGRTAGAWSWSDLGHYVRHHPWFGPLAAAGCAALAAHIAIHEGR